MRFSTLLLLAPLAVLGCSGSDKDADEDDDGGSGIDSSTADDDGDGLTNGEEADLGTDPNKPDSDGDGYLDSDEVAEGTDPTDAEDGIYIGGWPFQADKDAYGDPDEEVRTTARIGKFVPRAEMVDQFGEMVDTYDYAGQGKPVLIDLSAQWCGPCNAIAAWLAGQDDGYDSYFPTLREKLEAGDFYWITVLGENNQGAPANDRTTAKWYEAYPDDRIAVLGDEGQDYVMMVGWWPTFVLVDENFEVISSAEGDDDRYMEALYYIDTEL